MDLAANIQRNMHNGATGVVDKSSGKILMWHRDLGHCWQHLVMEALSSTLAVYTDPETKRAPDETYKILDTIGRVVRMIRKTAMDDNIKGLQAFQQLYDYLQEQEMGSEVYATFSCFFFQAAFCYQFTSKKMAMGLPQHPDNEKTMEYTAVLQVLSLLDDDLMVQVFNQLKDRGAWPTTIDYSSLLRRIDNFVKVAEEDHERYQQELARKGQLKKLQQDEAAEKKKARAEKKAQRKQRKESRGKK